MPQPAGGNNSAQQLQTVAGFRRLRARTLVKLARGTARQVAGRGLSTWVSQRPWLTAPGPGTSPDLFPSLPREPGVGPSVREQLGLRRWRRPSRAAGVLTWPARGAPCPRRNHGFAPPRLQSGAGAEAILCEARGSPARGGTGGGRRGPVAATAEAAAPASPPVPRRAPAPGPLAGRARGAGPEPAASPPCPRPRRFRLRSATRSARAPPQPRGHVSRSLPGRPDKDGAGGEGEKPGRRGEGRGPGASRGRTPGPRAPVTKRPFVLPRPALCGGPSRPRPPAAQAPHPARTRADCRCLRLPTAGRSRQGPPAWRGPGSEQRRRRRGPALCVCVCARMAGRGAGDAATHRNMFTH